MEIKKSLEDYTTPQNGATSRRAYYISQLLEGYNKTTESKYQKTATQMGVKLAPLSLQDLIYLLDECGRAKHFGKYLNWSINARNVSEKK